MQFFITELSCLDKINKILPQELIDVIKNYLTISSTIFLNKINYINNHTLIRKLIPTSKIENYIRDMIRRDNTFVFQ